MTRSSIADITSTCGLNRQTFYYHFEDKYELLNWIYYTEGFARLVDGITLENWDSHIAVLFETMRADKSSTKIRCAVRRTPLKLFVQSGARTFPGGRRSFGQWHGTGCRQGVFCRLLCLRKLRNSQSSGGCRYENAAGGAGPQPKTASAQDSEKLAYRRYVEAGRKACFVEICTTKKGRRRSCGGPSLVIRKSPAACSQQSEKVFPVRFLQHGIDCIIQLAFCTSSNKPPATPAENLNEVACRSRRVLAACRSAGCRGGFQRCSLQLLFKGHLITLLRFYPTPWSTLAHRQNVRFCLKTYNRWLLSAFFTGAYNCIMTCSGRAVY